MIPAFLTIGKKEIMDNIRNLSIIIFTIIFAILVLIVSYYGSTQQGFQDIGPTIIGMILLVYFLVPIIGLILGHAAINKEVESGSMNSLLTYPVERWEVIFGKFIGLGCVLSFSILVGFGIAGLIIGLNISNVDYGSYLFFIFSTIILGLIFMSLSMMFSSILKNRSSSIVIAIFLWFLFTMIWSFIIAGLVFASSSSFDNFPDWIVGFDLINPISAFGGLVTLNVVPLDPTELQSLPGFYKTEILIMDLLLWILIPLLATILIFYKKDI